jgi:hypothetical protein
MASMRRMPPTSVHSARSSRAAATATRSTSETIAPCMMSAGATPCDRWLITSDSANTAHTPEMFVVPFEVSTSGPISSVE